MSSCEIDMCIHNYMKSFLLTLIMDAHSHTYSLSHSHTHCHTHVNKHSSRFFITTLKPIGVGAIFPIIAALGLFYSMAFLLKTACTDPGIIPRAKPDELDYQLKLADDGECFIFD